MCSLGSGPTLSWTLAFLPTEEARTHFCRAEHPCAEEGDCLPFLRFLVALCRLIIRPEDLKPRSERRRDAFNCTFGGRMNPNHEDPSEFLSELRPESFITVPEIILSLSSVFSLLLLRGRLACEHRPSVLVSVDRALGSTSSSSI